MLRKFWILAIMLLPAFGIAAEKPATLKFFDAIPGEQNSNPPSAATKSGKDFDIFLENWGHVELGGTHEIQLMNLPADPQLRSEMIQRLLIYRVAKRASAVAQELPVEQPKLAQDLEWARKNGLTVANLQALTSLDQTLNRMTRDQQLEYALRVPGTVGQTLLDGAFAQFANPDLALRLLILNHQSLSPERRTTLIFKYLGELNMLMSQTNSPMKDLRVFREAASLLDFRSPHTICRTVADGFIPTDSQGSSAPRNEQFGILIRGFIEMKKQNVDCRDYVSPDLLIYKLDAFEREGVVQRGFFADLIHKLRRGESMRSSLAPNASVTTVSNQKLKECLIDLVYSDEVEVELNKSEKMPVGGRLIFGVLSKGACKLAVDFTKLNKGFRAYIVLDNSSGANLFKFDRAFDTVQAMKTAAITGHSPEEIAARNAARSKNKH